MTDNTQRSRFPQGVNTPNVESVVSVAFADGMIINSTPTPVVLTLGSMNVGTFNFSLADDLAFNAKYNFKVSLGTAISFVSLEIAAQSYVGSPQMTQTINITSVADSDKNILQFRTVSLIKNSINNRMSLVVTYWTQSSGSTTATVTCDVMGNPAPLNITLTNPAFNTTVPVKLVDARDTFEVLPYRTAGQQISLNNITKPGVVSCNPTDVASRPSGSGGIGTCITVGSGDTDAAAQLSQIFTDSTTGRMYTRTMGPDGVTWGTWSTLLRQADIGDIINSTTQSMMLDSIVFG